MRTLPRKNSRLVFFAAAMSLLIGASARRMAAAPPSAEVKSSTDVFARLEAGEKETSSVSFDFAQTVRFDIQDYVQKNTGGVIFMKPEHLRIELKKPIRQITVSDGKILRNYNADTNQLVVSDWKKIKDTGMLFGWPDSFAGNISAIRDKYNLKQVESSTDTIKLALEDKKSGFAMFMLFDASSLDPLSTELVSKGVKITTNISGFKRNPALAKDAFKFTPPKGAEIIGP